MRRPRILLLVALPPPVHGQSLMQQALVDSRWEWCNAVHVDLRLSRDGGDVGRFRPGKILGLLGAVLDVLRARLAGPVDLLYYVPAPPRVVPVLRDLLLLAAVRPMSRRLLLHFHAGGFDRIRTLCGGLFRLPASLVYGDAAGAVVTSEALRPEVEWIVPHRVSVVPNGVEDGAGGPRATPAVSNLILYAGSLSEVKGIPELLDAVELLVKRGTECRLVLLGEFRSRAFRRTVERRAASGDLRGRVHLAGSCTGRDKWEWFHQAACLCLPSRDLEAQPLALLEAMCWSLPAAASAWRTHADILGDGGICVPPGDAPALAGALDRLLRDPALRSALGAAGRRRYEERYTLSSHRALLAEALRDALGDTVR